jgi:hypothetical protein
MRIKPMTLLEFKALARLRGVSMSTFVHQYIVEQIRQEKRQDPTAFLQAITEIQREETEKNKASVQRFDLAANNPAQSSPADSNSTLGKPDDEEEPLIETGEVSRIPTGAEEKPNQIGSKDSNQDKPANGDSDDATENSPNSRRASATTGNGASDL